MKFPHPLTPGILIQRYKRFLADIRLNDGTIITAHCPNSGSMRSCKTPGSPVMLSHHSNPKRKYAYTWEMVKVNSAWVGINTYLPNRLVAEAIRTGRIPELTGYSELLTEQRVGKRSRLDLLLRNGNQLCYVEIKNVTLVEENIALFPDAVTARGARHLDELMALKAQGHRAVIFFVIQRPDGAYFAPADHIDAVYGTKLRTAYEKGVEILPYRALVTPAEIRLDGRLEFKL